MNVPLIPSAAPGAQIPGSAGRGTDTADPSGFSDALSRQREPLRGSDRTARGPEGASRKGADTAKDTRRPPTPEETLALLAAGATLPLMGASQAAPAGEAPQGDDGPARRALPATASADGAASAARDTRAPLRADPGAALAGSPDAAGRGTREVLPGDTPATRLDGPAATGLAAARPDSRGAAASHGGGRGADDTAPATPTGGLLAGIQAATASPVSAAAPAPSTHAPGADLESAMAQLAAAPPQAALAGAAGTDAGPAPAATRAVATPLGDPAWPADFGRQVLSLARDGRGGAQTAELRLNPPELGPVRIVLHISDSVAQALFVSPHAPVRHALENALPQLQQQLAQAGLSLGQADVSDQQPGQQQAFAQAGSQGRGDAGAAVFSLDGAASPPAMPTPPDTAQRRAGRMPDALVDTFA